MASRAASIAVVAAGAYGACTAFTSVTASAGHKALRVHQSKLGNDAQGTTAIKIGNSSVCTLSLGAIAALAGVSIAAKRNSKKPSIVRCAAAGNKAEVVAAKKHADLLLWAAKTLVSKGSPQAASMQAKAEQAVQTYEALKNDEVAASAATSGFAPAATAPAASSGPAPPAKKLTKPADLLDSVDIFIFDCDGVIWRGDSIIPGIPDVLDKLRAAGKRLFFVTNNSTKSRAGYQSKFTSLGLDVKPEEIFSSSFAAAAYFEQTKFKDTGKKIYIIGEKGISEELDLIGVPHFGAEDDASKQAVLGPGCKVDHDPNVGAVVVGFDRHINYYKLQYAQLCLNENPGCEFVATNLDRVTHLTDAQEWAGNGTMVGAIKGCTGREPTLVGKPAPLMIDYIADKYNISNRSRICMVGDRLDTDIAFGRNNGLKTCLTLTGVTNEDELLDKKPRKAGTEGIQPEFYVDSINDFVAGGSAAVAVTAVATSKKEIDEAKKNADLLVWAAKQAKENGLPQAAVVQAKADQAVQTYEALKRGETSASGAAPAPSPVAVPPAPIAVPSGSMPTKEEIINVEKELTLLQWAVKTLAAQGSPQVAGMKAKAEKAQAEYKALQAAFDGVSN